MGLESIFSMLGGQSGGAMSAINGAFNSGMTNAANMKMAKYQYSQEMDMWNKANAYNSPSAQMDRLKAAGLNPNLIYGNGSAATGQTANQLPRYQAPTMRADVMPEGNSQQNSMNTYQDYKIKDAQIDNLKAQNDNIKNESALKAVSIALNQGTLPYKIEKSGWEAFGSKYKADVDYSKSELMKNSLDYAKATLEDRINNIRIKNQIGESMIPQIQASTGNINSRTEGQNLMNQYQSSINKFASSSQIANIISKVLPSLLRIR
nr:MAG: DNA pilot protein [Microviridae sp.]